MVKISILKYGKYIDVFFLHGKVYVVDLLYYWSSKYKALDRLPEISSKKITFLMGYKTRP